MLSSRSSFRRFKVIVLYDCSTDNNLAGIWKLASALPAIPLVRNEKNLGVTPSLNEAVWLFAGPK
jgi:hypothetical protein